MKLAAFSGLPPSFIDELFHVLLCNVGAIQRFVNINRHQTDINVSGSPTKSDFGLIKNG